MEPPRGSWLIRLIIFTIFSVIFVGVHGFDPRAYDAEGGKEAACDAVKRTVTLSRTAKGAISKSKDALVVENEETVTIQIRYIDINPTAEKTILMIHGWPGMWSTWAYQIEEFKNDFRLIVPNLRGFGNSTLPGNMRSSGTMQDLVSDMMCVLKHAGVDDVICMGHDWGSQICYEMGRARPDITSAVVGVSIPYVPATRSFTPTTSYVKFIPRFMYQIFFDEQTNKAVAELDTDIRRSLRAIYRSLKVSTPDGFFKKRDTFLGPFGSKEVKFSLAEAGAMLSEQQILPIIYLTPEEEDYFVEQFEIQGFKSTLYFYATENRYQSWKFPHDQGNHTISQPVLTVNPSKDLLVNWKLVAFVLRSSKYIPNLTTETIPGDHYPQMESPEAFNTVVRTWMSKVGLFRSEPEEKTRAADEL
ncbi:alpha/beta-hydrolase [Amanita muscaria]